MELIAAIILGIIQGITEWLPISSEAMVTLAGKFLFNYSYTESLENAIWLHTGTLIAAVIYFREELIKLNKELILFLIITTIATGIIAVPLLFLAFSLELPEYLFTILIGLFLILISFIQKRENIGNFKLLTKKNSIIAGLIQGLAILPGISRSGITIASLLGMKYSLKDAFKLSFLMSIPVVAGVEVAMPLVRGEFTISLEMITGTIAAAIIGYLTIGILIRFAEKINFSRAVLILGILVILMGIGTTL